VFTYCSLIEDVSGTIATYDIAPQVHAISDERRRQIHALLTDDQKELEKEIQRREHNRGSDSDAISWEGPAPSMRSLLWPPSGTFWVCLAHTSGWML
jgi:hypothetical protein